MTYDPKDLIDASRAMIESPPGFTWGVFRDAIARGELTPIEPNGRDTYPTYFVRSEFITWRDGLRKKIS